MGEFAAMTPPLHPHDGRDALILLRCMGLAVSEREGKVLVSGLATLDADDRQLAAAWVTAWRDEILHWLAWEELSPAQREAAEREARQSFWPLRRRYTSWQQVKSAMHAHGLRAVRCGDDFEIIDARSIPFEKLPGIVDFFHHNTKIILQNLDDLPDVPDVPDREDEQ